MGCCNNDYGNDRIVQLRSPTYLQLSTRLFLQVVNGRTQGGEKPYKAHSEQQNPHGPVALPAETWRHLTWLQDKQFMVLQ